LYKQLLILVSQIALSSVFYGQNVGIGTTSPTQKLHINGTMQLDSALFDGQNSPGVSGNVLISTGQEVQWVNPQSISGLQGPTGIQGNTGATGPQGPTGVSSSGGGNGSANAQSFYITFQTSQDKKVNSDPLFDDGIVRFGWDAPGNDLEFYLIPGSEPNANNPVSGQAWGNISSGGIPNGDLACTIWNMDATNPSVSTYIVSSGAVYDLKPSGVAALEIARGIIAPEYDFANPGQAPNYNGYSSSNDFVGTGPPFPMYRFELYNISNSRNTVLWIQKIANN